MEIVSLVLLLIGVITSGAYFDKAILLIFASGVFGIAGGLYSIGAGLKKENNKNDFENEKESK